MCKLSLNNMSAAISCVAVCLTIVLSACSGFAQTVNLTLDLYYSDPTDTNSAGVWELVARASDRGLAGANVRVADILSDAMFMAPTGTATGLPVAGFQENFGPVNFAFDNGDHFSMVFAQVQTAEPNPQGLLYDVGVPGGATQPGENGTPSVPGFIGANVPWNYDDLIGDFGDDGMLNGSGPFQNATLLALGMFGANSSPQFYVGEASAANLFTQLGTGTSPPPNASIVEATVTTTVRDNTAILAGDANFDGTVDGRDFLIWNANKFTSTAGWRNGDFNGDKVIDGQDFLVWNDNKFMSADAGLAVPEPSWGAAVGVVLFMLAFVRRGAFGSAEFGCWSSAMCPDVKTSSPRS